MTAQVLQEYLVSLGFTVNQAQLRSFGDALKGTATSAAKLGAEVVATGIALTEMVDQVARHFENLYYVGQRTGATVKNLDAISYAARQIGVSTEAAIGSIEGMAHAIRTQPGVAALLRAQGLDPNDPHGATLGIVARLKKQFGEKGYFAAQAQAAGIYGMDEQTFNSYWHFGEQLRIQEEDHLKRMREAGLDADDEARKFTEFGRVMNHLADQFSIVGTRIAEDFRPGVQGIIEDLDKMIGRFGAADKASGGKLGIAAGAAGATGAGAGIMAILGKIFGFSIGVGPRMIGAVGAPLAAMELMNDRNAQDVTDLRTGLRSLLGIPDPHEPLPWAPGGNWDPHRPENIYPLGPPSGSGRSGSGLPRIPTIPPVGSSSRAWGDDEAVAAGLYDPIVPTPRARPDAANVTINQTNSFGDVRDMEMTIGRVQETNRELGSALRNLAAKLQ